MERRRSFNDPIDNNEKKIMPNPLTLMMPCLPGTNLIAVAATLKEAQPQVDIALAKIGTVHYARFLMLDRSQATLQPQLQSGALRHPDHRRGDRVRRRFRLLHPRFRRSAWRSVRLAAAASSKAARRWCRWSTTSPPSRLSSAPRTPRSIRPTTNCMRPIRTPCNRSWAQANLTPPRAARHVGRCPPAPFQPVPRRPPESQHGRSRH